MGSINVGKGYYSRRVEVNLGYVVKDSVDIAREVNGIWYLTAGQFLCRGGGIGCRTREQEVVFILGQDRKTIEV